MTLENTLPVVVPEPEPPLLPAPPDPFVNDLRPYVRFSLSGEIYGGGMQAVGFTQMRQERDEALILEGDGDYDIDTRLYRNYVDKTETGVWVLKPRPVLEAEFDRLVLAAYEEARIEDLPEARVAFTGPTSGTVEHPGGLFEIGWTVPGRYRVTINCRPHLPAVYEFTVS